MRTIVMIAVLFAGASFAQAQSTYRYGNEVPQQNYGNVAPQPSYGNVLPQQNYGNVQIQPNYGGSTYSYNPTPQTGYVTPAYGADANRRAGNVTSAYGSDLTPLQRLEAANNLRSANIQPVQGTFRAAVGQMLPTSVAQPAACPPAVAGLVRGVSNCQVLLAGDRYYIVEGSTRRVVNVIER